MLDLYFFIYLSYNSLCIWSIVLWTEAKLVTGIRLRSFIRGISLFSKSFFWKQTYKILFDIIWYYLTLSAGIPVFKLWWSEPISIEMENWLLECWLLEWNRTKISALISICPSVHTKYLQIVYTNKYIQIVKYLPCKITPQPGFEPGSLKQFVQIHFMLSLHLKKHNTQL